MPVVAPGTGVVAGLDFVIGGDPRARAPIPTAKVVGVAPLAGHSTQAGTLADLDAPAFSSENGLRGDWAPMEFFRNTGGNIYFLEPYNPNKTPILFVHGAAGSPQDWRYFIDNIDRSRYQPWVFFYPSGAAVDSMAYLLYWKLFNLQLKHHFERICITAHSMGGLVVRTFLLNHGEQFPQAKLFVSLSTPWAGETSADLGVKHSPAVVPSWHDMQPEGRFMKALFARPLPPGIDHYLLFGHRGGYSMLRPNNDGTVTLASQLRNPAQAEARMVYGFDEDHASILSSRQVLDQYKAILSNIDKQAGGEARPGRVRVDFAFDGPSDGPKTLPLLVLKPAMETPRQRRGMVTMPLTADDSGRVVGPIPAGLYDASLISAAFKTEPRSTRIEINALSTPTLGFRLVPQGTLSGYVGADLDSTSDPAGSFRRPHPSVKITAITLRGAGAQRTLVPRQSGADGALESYLRGEDDAFQSGFSFVVLAAGDYELTLLAEGYRPHTSRHTVMPRRQAILIPISLEPLR